jgi:hypothetical protein
VGLVAARQLADALVRGAGPEGYARDFHRRWGTLLRSYDLLRRLSQRLSAREVGWMMRAGLMNEATVRMALEQRLPGGRAPV